MLSLADYLEQKGVGKSEFARRLSKRVGHRVPPQSVHRWTLPKNDDNYSVPRQTIVEAIEEETEGAVAPETWYRRRRTMAIAVAASRKAAVTRRRQREARP